MNTWLCLLLIWCVTWWVYAAYMLLIPPPGCNLFNLHEDRYARLLIMLMWAVLVLTAPVWAPLQELFGDDR